MKARLVGSLASCAFLVLGCATNDEAEIPVTVRDSAGVQIVENPGDDAGIPQWELEAPRVTIGVMEGEPAYQLDQVSGALSNGEKIVVLNGGSRELRFFDGSGTHVRTVGRQGGGPGEFERPQWLGPHAGDSVVVYDLMQNRFSYFDATGEFGHAVTPVMRGGGITGRLADGSYIVRPAISIGGGGAMPTDGLRREQVAIVRIAADGQSADTLAIYPGVEATVSTRSSGGNLTSISIRMRPFGLSTYAAAGDSLIFVGSSEAWAIDVLNGEGTRVRSIRRAAPLRALTPEDRSRYVEDRLASITDANRRTEMEQYYANESFPEVIPAFQDVRVDTDGNLWVQDYVVSRADSLRWSVFTPTGRIVGRVAMPPRTVVYQIGPDFVLGRVQDELDIEQVVLFGLSRSRSREIADAGSR